MNYVKKLLVNNWLLFVFICLLLSASIVLICLHFRNSKTLEFLTIPTEYYIEYEDETILYTSIKCSRKDTMYLNKELINDVYIFDNDTKEEYLVNLVEIKNEDLFEYNEVNYYDYKLKLLIPFKTDSLISLENCYLHINYLNDEKLDFKLGKVFLYNKEESQKAFTISSLKGIVSTYNDKQTLSGVILSLNKEFDDLTITNIESIDNNVLVNKSKIIELDHCDYEATTPIKEILGYEYDIYDTNIDKDISYEILDNLILFIPLSYLTKVNVSTLGFKITYLQGQKECYQIIEPFMFFKTYEDTIVDHFVYDFN